MTARRTPSGRRVFLQRAGSVSLALAGLSLPACSEEADPPPASPRKRLAILGGGAAGVFTAWLLEPHYDVTLYEATATLGGNVRTVSVAAASGESVVVDLGAQYYHPGAYPAYSALLELLGIASPDDEAPGDAYPSPSSITVFSADAQNPTFVSPVVPDKTWPLGAAWNAEGIDAFAKLTAAAKAHDEADGSWATPLEDWLATLDLTEAQRETLCLPWAASLISGDIAQVRRASARAVLVYLARTAPDNPIETVRYRVLRQGLGAVLDALVAQCPTLALRVDSAVKEVTRVNGGLSIATSSDVAAYDVVVVASPAHAAVTFLAPLEGAEAQREALAKFAWFDAKLAIHRDRAYAPAADDNVSFLNCEHHGAYCEASMSLASCLPPLPSGEPVALWKSWTTHRDAAPAEPVVETEFKHVDPSPQTIAAQEELAPLQGQGGVWFVGGWTRPFDAQETALRSALAVASVLAPEGARVGLLAEFVEPRTT